MARFTPGDSAYNQGRPVTIAAVNSNGDTPLYSFFYTDAKGGTQIDLPGRVLSTRGPVTA